MDPLWIMFLIIWANMEFVQFLRKKPFPQRMKVAAVWAVVLVSFASLGQANREISSFGFLPVALAINGAMAALLYWLRVGLAHGWRRVVQRNAGRT